MADGLNQLILRTVGVEEADTDEAEAALLNISELLIFALNWAEAVRKKDQE